MAKKELLKELGLEEAEEYSLINNHGFTFKKNGVKYDLRHVLNVYGESVDFWYLNSTDSITTFDTFEEALAEIKKL